MTDKFLDKVYCARTPDETRDIYDAWSKSYEAEISGNGYATPGRVAEALAGIVKDKTTPILDFGCGTGLSGLALKLAGFEVIDGMDLSSEMLAEARTKGIYRNLTQVATDAPPPITQGAYPIITAIGVIGLGAAPHALFDTLMKALGRGGLFAFSFNDHTLEDPAYEGRLNEWIDPGAARLRFREYGAHLPGKNMKSVVYIVEKN
ncbi:methyltransferase [Primorskyibacter aestuariivivens]|uniref:class I SAM-dependent DNA methyltransferase n=1 Tax=Primorskyibacter aestuariivivens TaxID=1888912 RepID=UPI0023019420|nr:methyltransferase domain-containing protein [Primorskyibacter aestuariivivens]MDA7427007.1 methyltransferase [Primorskyibacter aestuariivivens]